MRASVRTVELIIEKSTDPKARATAIGHKQSILQPRFLLLLVTCKPVLEAINKVSKFLQTVQRNIGAAIAKVEGRKKEIRLLK